MSRDFHVGGNVLHTYVDLFNVYDRLNVGSYSYSGTYRSGTLVVQEQPGHELLPVLPTFGLTFRF